MKTSHKREYVCADSDSEDNEDVKIERVDDRLYFYAPINTNTVFTFITLLRKMSTQFKKLEMEHSIKKCIHIHIHSSGGDLHAGLGAMDHILNCEVECITHADGFVASAATLMLIAGHQVKMGRHSTILIHQLSVWFGGTYECLKDEKQNSDSIMKVMTDAYREHTRMNEKKLQMLMKRDVYIHAEEALKLGIVGEIC